MADATVHRCCFQWDIYNPFLPWRDLEATFFHGSPTVTQWKVTLQPMDRGMNYWRFSFSLEFLEWNDHRREILAERVLLLINLNGASVSRQEFRNHCFCRANRGRCYFQNIILMYPQMEPHHLEIRIEISLPGRTTGNEVGNGLFSTDHDLHYLSIHLNLLRIDPQYSDMNFLSRDGPEPIQAHSYIIDARWNNFFREHCWPESNLATIEPEISHALLKDILTYMYAGQLGISWPDWTDAEYITEMFQVIKKYELYHLYKVFVKSDLQQVRVTRNPLLIESRLFPLDLANGRPIKNASRTWYVNPNPEYALIFRILVRNENRAGPWLSYTLQSKSPSMVYAQVNLDVIKKREGNSFGRVLPFHARDCTIEPDATVESGPVLFLGCPETFGVFNPTPSGGTEIEYFIRCLLNVANRTTVDQVRCVDDDTLQDELVRFGVLSDHMHELHKRKFHADMQIRSRLEEDYLSSVEGGYLDHIHKGILAARIHEWRFGLENVPQANGIPDEARSTLSEVTLPFVLDYLYAGKVFTMPPFIDLDEVVDFARETSFGALYDFVMRMPSS